jgi:TM2 domain-containing membrane protein YozV
MEVRDKIGFYPWARQRERECVMSTPNQPDEPFANSSQPYQPPGYGHPYNSGYPSQYYPGYPSQPAAYPGYQTPSYRDPTAPYGRDSGTGEPLSDKSALAAGTLQLFLGWFGVGRFYIGSPTIGILQLASFLMSLFLCLFLIGLLLWPLVAIWVFVDAMMMYTGSVKDGQGRKLRPAGN